MSQVKRISCEDAKKLHEQGTAIFWDIRDPRSFEASHIPGAIRLHDGNVEELAAKTNKDAVIIVNCYHGNSSQGAAAYLAEKGFKNAHSMNGGFEEWRSKYPTE